MKNVNVASRLSKVWNFFGAIQMISCRARLVNMASSSLIIFRRFKLSTWSIIHLCWSGAIEGHFEGKIPQGVQQGGLVLARKCPDSPGTYNPEDTGLPGLKMP
jgi:hypothetical protein